MTQTAITSRNAARAAGLGAPGLVPRVLPGALVAAALDAGFSVVALVVVLGRYSLLGALQYIASGMLGKAAFTGGLATAALGVLVHLSLAFGCAALYALAWRALPALQRMSPVALGLAYGAGIWIVMDCLVLPLSGVPHFHDGAGYFLAFLADHALFVGLPIAVLHRRGLG